MKENKYKMNMKANKSLRKRKIVWKMNCTNRKFKRETLTARVATFKSNNNRQQQKYMNVTIYEYLSVFACVCSSNCSISLFHYAWPSTYYMREIFVYKILLFVFIKTIRAQSHNYTVTMHEKILSQTRKA